MYLIEFYVSCGDVNRVVVIMIGYDSVRYVSGV